MMGTFLKIKIYLFLLLVTSINLGARAQAIEGCKENNDSIVEQIQIIDIDMDMDDIDDKNRVFDQSILTKINSQNGIYIDDDGNEIQAMKSSRDLFFENIRPPKKFYRIYRCYYLNGKIKAAGIMITDGSLIKNFYQYDEEGNKTVIDFDKEYDEFDYNKVFLWLDKEGYIDLKTGRGRHYISLEYEKEKKQWYVNIKHNEETGLKFQDRFYKLDGHTGKILEKYDLISYE